MHITINTADSEQSLDIDEDSGTRDDLVKLISDEVTSIPADWTSLVIVVVRKG